MSNWPTVKLGDVCEEMRDRISTDSITVAQYITTDNMVKNCSGVSQAESLPPSGSLVRFNKNDVLLSNIRPYLKKAWLADRDGGCSSDVIVFRIRDTVSLLPEYLYRALSQDAFFSYSMENVTGTKMPRGKRDWIKQFEFTLPPPAEQRTIVARLEKELATADKVAVRFSELAATAETEFKATLEETFAKTKFPTARLGEIGRVAMCKRIMKDQTSSSGDIPFFKIGTFGKKANAYISRAIFDEYSTKYSYPKKGDILLSAAGTIGKAVEFDGTPSYYQDSNIVWLEHNGTIVDNQYLYFFYLTKPWNIAEGATIQRLYNDNIANAIIPLPPLAEQREIVARLTAAAERRDKIVELARRGAETAATWRKAILKEAFQ